MDKPNEVPEIVYKYRNWSDDKHKNVLIKNELFLPSSREFNDPFDCKIPENFLTLDTDEKICEFVDKSIKKHNDLLNLEGRNIQFEKEKLINWLKKDIQGFQKHFEGGWFSFLENYYGVLSLSKRWDSILMWSHYADKHRGYCIGFYEEKLYKLGDLQRGGLVNYEPENSFPSIDPMEKDDDKKVVIATQLKSFDWQYEEEYRFFKSFHNQTPTDEERKLYFNDDCIAEVIIGLCTSEADGMEIKNICLEKGILMNQVEKIPFKFQIQKKPI
ncbi:MAG: DUF2971 domain-containing protein [Bacteroidales bacterium]|jgi:hypothetical protein